MTTTAAGSSDRDRSVTMLDIARAANVSRSTVSLVMQKSQLVADSTRDRVLETAADLGYVYNRGAAGIRTQRSNLIGLAIPDISNPFIAEAARGIQSALDEKGYFVVVTNTDDDLHRQSLVLRSLAEHRVDGVLLMPAIGTTKAALSAPEFGAIPFVLMNRTVPRSGLPFAGPHERPIGELGARHLIDVHDVDTLAYFGGPEEASPRKIRSRAFREVVAASGARLRDQWCVTCEQTPAAAYALARDLLDRGEPPAGVQCHNDSVAYGLMRALRERGYDRAHCRVIGADDAPESEFWNPPLTSIAVDPSAIGEAGGRQLLALMEGRHPGKAAIPAPRLTPRASCGC